MLFHAKHLSCTVLCMIYLLFPLAASGQDQESLLANPIDLAEFAAHPRIMGIAQDNHGLIWMSSDFGFYRYDGVHVRHYTKSAYPDLPSDDINAVLVDYHGKLWIATSRGLAVMDTEKEIIESYPLGSENGNPRDPWIPTSLLLSQDSAIWVGLNQNGYAKIDVDYRHEIYTFDVPQFQYGRCFGVKKMFQDISGNIFMEAVCLYRIALIQINLQAARPVSNLMYLTDVGTANLLQAGQKVYLMDRKSMKVFNAHSQQFDPFVDSWVLKHIPGFVPWSIMADGSSSFWIGSQAGYLAHGTLTQDTVYMESIGKATKSGVRTIMKDRSGCLWLGTDDGAYYLPRTQTRFTSHLSSKSSEVHYGMRMRGIIEAQDGLIYICTPKGVARFNPLNKTFKLILPEDGNVSQPYTLCTGAGNYLWVGSDGYGLRKLDLQTMKYYDYISPLSRNEELGGSWVGELVTDTDSTLWVGTSNGISYSVRQLERLRIARDSKGRSLLSDVFVHDIKEIRKGQFWIGTDQGLFQMAYVGKLPEATFFLTRYEHVPYRIREICLTSRSDIWLATEDAGLVHYYPLADSQSRFTEANGLPSDVLYSLLAGPMGEFWIGTFDGLSRYDTTSGLFSNFYVSDGLPDNEFNSQSQCIGRDSTYYMGTQNGIVSFDPRAFAIDSSGLPVIISGVSKLNTKLDSVFVETRFTTLTSGVDLGPHDNLVTLQYSIADYNKPEGNRFQYMLDGLSSKWHYVGNRTELVLPHLDAGDYRVILRGAGSDGSWSSQRIVIPIHVSEAYYNTWWFKLLILAILGIVMWLIHRYQLRQVLKLQRIRLQIAEDLHDELGSTLTGIGIQTELLTATETSKGRISKLREISGHLQDAVSKLGDIVWSLQSGAGSMGELMDRVEEQAHMMLDPGEVECHIDFPQGCRDLELNSIIKQNCFLILKEALTNIVKHSNANRVEITLNCRHKGLFLSITDNGNVASPSEKSQGGNGLKNMRRRAEKMSGVLSITNQRGYRIEISVPKAFSV